MREGLEVLHLVEEFPPPERLAGGAPISIRLQIEALSRLCRVTVVAPRPRFLPLGRYAHRSATPHAEEEREPFPGVFVHRPGYLHLPLLWPLTTPLQLVWITCAAWRRHAPGAALVHGHRGYPMGFAAVLAARFTGRKSVWTAHGSDVHAQATRGEGRVRWPLRWAIRHADRVIAVSEELRRIARALGARPESLEYVPNGVDLARFPALSREEARRTLGRDPERRLVVCAANLVPIKGHAVLLEAWARILRKTQGTDLALLGDGPLRSELEAMARRLGLADRVRFHGQVSYADMPAWLAASDLVVLPSYGEGTPLIALEALAAGRPVVGTDVGGTAEVLSDRIHGIRVPPGDPVALAAAVQEALATSWDETALRERAGDYAWPLLATRILAVYRETTRSPA